MRRAIPSLLVLVTLVACTAPAQETLTDAPPPDRREVRRGELIERLAEAVEQLDLSADQRRAVSDVLTRARADAAAARGRLRDDRPAAIAELRDVADRTRGELGRILTPPQQEKLRNLMQRDSTPPPPPPATAPPAMTGGEMTGGEMMGEMTPRGPKPPATAPAPPASTAASLLARMNPIAVGQPAPEFRIIDLTGKSVTLANLPRKPVVLVFGSYSNPSFRQRLPALRAMADRYGRRVHVLVIYTREAHAAGEWEVQRNRIEDIAVDQPEDFDARLAAARLANDKLKIGLPVAVDGIDDATALAFGVFPNGAVILSKDRTVTAVQRWLDPSALEALLTDGP